MRPSIARAIGYAAVSLLALTAAVFEGLALVTFALVAILAAVAGDGMVFRLFADRAERQTGRLLGLIEFGASVSVLAAVALLDVIPRALFVGVVLLVGFGYLGAEVARLARSDRLSETTGFITVGFVAYVVGHVAGEATLSVETATIGTLAMAGALAGALLRSAAWTRHDGLLVIALGGFLWVLYLLPTPTTETVAIAIATAIVLAYLALVIGVASVTGMAAGVLMVLLTIVFGGLVWVSMLVAFFGIGGLATKFRYSEKHLRGVAEANRGVRGTGNVLGNTIVALVAVLGYAAVTGDPTLELFFAFAFAGSIATALSDTLSSEIGGLYDEPVMITTFDRVAPGTDGAVSLVGTVAGIVGAGIVAGVFVVLGPVAVVGGVVVTVAGTLGMLVDSVLGASLEGRLMGNHGVNASATFAGAVIAGATVLVGIV